MITTWFLAIVTFLIGYFLGQYSVSPEKKEELIQTAQRIVRKVGGHKIGAIDPLSPAEMAKPRKIKDTEDAMNEDLDKIL